MENINSPIYYSQSNGKTFSKAEVIGQGILPLVRADSLGNVHVIWANSDGALVDKIKIGDRWGTEQILLKGIDPDYVWDKMYENTSRFKKMNAEFDKDNNLYVVFISNGQLVYAKIRVN
jgi:Neuraminidase (sialidase)